MFFFRYLARPKGSHPEHDVLAGALIDCRIKEPVEGAAKTIAVGVIEQEGWDIEALEESKSIEPADQITDADMNDCLRRAELDGMCFGFHPWRIGEAEPHRSREG